jgi:CRP/FNR family transcriptional regulator
MAGLMPLKNLAPNEILFQVGDLRDCLYRIVSGSVCIYEPHLNGSRAVIDFAFPGDLVGMGFLRKQTCTARAMVETRIACLPLASMDSLVAGKPRVEAKLAQAIEREFELHKSSLVEAGRQNPIERVAALLVGLSQVNDQEGRDKDVIVAPSQCGAVAGRLELSIDDLASTLSDLEALGLIEACPVPGATQGIRIKDHDRLAEIADGFCSAVLVNGSSFGKAPIDQRDNLNQELEQSPADIV